MNVSLTPELESLVKSQVSTGVYNSASEVVRDALRLFEEREKLRKIRREELTKKLKLGIDQADRGELTDATEVFAALRTRSAARKSKP